MIDGVSPSPLVVNNLGLDFKQDMKTKLASYGKNQAAAVEIMTAAGWKQMKEKTKFISDIDYNKSLVASLIANNGKKQQLNGLKELYLTWPEHQKEMTERK